MTIDSHRRSAGRSSILIAWELGAGMGHLRPMLPLIRRFRSRGYRVSLVSRDLSRVSKLFEGLQVDCFQAPIKSSRSENRVVTPRSLAHVLHNSGFGDEEELCGLTAAWRNLYSAIRPDFILCDHSPTALLAARGCTAKVAITGTGFCCPPDLSPLPDFRPWLPDQSDQLHRDEEVILARVNRLLDTWGAPRFDRLSQLYHSADECFLATFRELDHYPMRPEGCYWGAWPNCGGAPPVWPASGTAKRIFAYLHRFPALPDLLKLLNELQLPTLVYCDAITPQIRQNFHSHTLHFVNGPLDLALVGSQCDLAILNGGHGATVSMLLAGRPILQLPCQLEQTLTGLATARLSAGLSVEPTQPAQIAGKLTAMLTSDRFAEGARRFAERYIDFEPERQLDQLVQRVEQLLDEHGQAKGRAPAGHIMQSDNAGASYSVPPTRAVIATASSRRIVIGIGTGRCGTRSLATLLDRQPSTAVGHEARPMLPWSESAASSDVNQRFQRLLDAYPHVARVGDVGHFYLPYVEHVMHRFHDVRVICLQRNREQTIDSFIRWLVTTRQGRPVNHWSADRDGFEADEWDATFPKYATRDMAEAIGRYWDEYYQRAGRLAASFPDRVHIFSTEEALNCNQGIAALLDWVGVPRSQQKTLVVHANRFQEAQRQADVVLK